MEFGELFFTNKEVDGMENKWKMSKANAMGLLRHISDIHSTGAHMPQHARTANLYQLWIIGLFFETYISFE